MPDQSPMYDYGEGRYGYREFHIVVFGGKPAVVLVLVPLAPDRGFQPIVRTRTQEAVVAAMRMIDTFCRDEAAVMAEKLMG